jgi:hypothetical protein
MMKNKKKGMALPVVVVLCMIFLGFATILVINSKSQRGNHSGQLEKTRAIMAAKAALQVAIYKFRVLPTEFYKIHELKMKALKDPSELPRANKAYSVWVSDFDTSIKDSPANKMKKTLDSMLPDDLSYDFGVEEFRLASSDGKGYEKDFIQIKAWGTYGKEKRALEEIIEIQIAKDI